MAAIELAITGSDHGTLTVNAYQVKIVRHSSGITTFPVRNLDCLNATSTALGLRTNGGLEISLPMAATDIARAQTLFAGTKGYAGSGGRPSWDDTDPALQ